MSIIERPCLRKDKSPTISSATEAPKRARPLLIAVVIACAAVVACTSAPYQEMSDARQALESAQQSVGQMPGPRSKVRRAETLLERAREHLGEREHAEARGLAEQAKSLAIEVRERAEQGAH